jgi:hypothetical protein
LQGGLGDCYLLSAIAALAEREDRVTGLFPDLESHHDTGIYSVTMSHCGVMREVVVDDYIPVDPAGRPAFVQPHKNEFWPLIMEKAWAKLNGSYGHIVGGLPHDVLNALTKAPTVYSRLCEPASEEDRLQMDSIWEQIVFGSKIGWCFCTGTTMDPSI